jgi:SWI/SNF-related matrix-associated actin-dependent regulator 1 of chromatin subfamily A
MFGGERVQVAREKFVMKWEGEVQPEARERLRRVSLRRTKDEVLPELPKKSYQRVLVESPISKSPDGATEALEKWDGLDGEFPGISELASFRAALAASKVPAALEYVEAAEETGEPLVVMSAHRLPLVAFQGREGWALITGSESMAERKAFVDRFQAGELRGLACTIGAAGVGLTMTRASTMLFIDRTWTPAENAQAEDRICRLPQTRPCQIVDLVADHPFERRLYEVLAKKQALMGAVL